MSQSIFDIAEFKERFDPLLKHELESHVARAAKFTNDAGCQALLSYVQKIALAGGKRIRPYAAYLMYCTAGGKPSDILPAFVAFEIFHTFALIHDDIIDHGALRHGMPSVHEFAKSFVSGSPEKAAHLAEGLALLAGDLCFNWSRETFAHGGVSAQAQDLFDAMVYAVVLGQMLDVKMVCQPDPSEEKIMEKTSLKTAEYTFVYPFKIGASLAGKHGEYDAFSETLGTSLGKAFQIQDDLIDIVGSAYATGKKSLQDIAEGQHTIFTAYLRAHASEEDRATFERFFGTEIHDEAIPELQSLFERSGAIAYGKCLLETEIAKAKVAVSELDAQTEVKEAWEALIMTMERRIK